MKKAVEDVAAFELSSDAPSDDEIVRVYKKLFGQNVSLDTPLKFNENDLVYGPSAGGKLRAWRMRCGGNLLDELYTPFDYGYLDWLSCSIATLNNWVKRGFIIHFDLTYMEDIPNVLTGIGKYANAITSGELRYIRDNWSKLSKNVKFYERDKEVSPPWIK